MSIFKRQAEQPTSSSVGPTYGSTPPTTSAREPVATRVARGTRVEGEIAGSTELLIEGEVDGTVKVDARVVIGSSGIVRGEVEAEEVLVGGTILGDVRGRGRVEVGASGRLEGDIAAPRVTIAEGAFFKGKVEMTGQRGSEGSSGAAASSAKPGPGKRSENSAEPGSGQKPSRPQGGA